MTESGVVTARQPVDAMNLASAARSAEFTRLYEEAFRDVSGYCGRLLRDDHLARDVTQEAFVRLFSRWRSVRDPRAFVFIVATNLARDELRRRTRQATLVDQIGPLVTAEERPADADVADIVLRLPKRLRDVVVLYVVLDRPVAEVARVLGIPSGTVKRRLHEARALLRIDWQETTP